MSGTARPGKPGGNPAQLNPLFYFIFAIKASNMSSTLDFLNKKKLDDVSLVKVDNTLSDLPRFRPLQWLKNRGLRFFYHKTYFSTYCLHKTP